MQQLDANDPLVGVIVHDDAGCYLLGLHDVGISQSQIEGIGHLIDLELDSAARIRRSKKAVITLIGSTFG